MLRTAILATTLVVLFPTLGLTAVQAEEPVTMLAMVHRDQTLRPALEVAPSQLAFDTAASLYHLRNTPGVEKAIPGVNTRTFPSFETGSRTRNARDLSGQPLLLRKDTQHRGRSGIWADIQSVCDRMYCDEPAYYCWEDPPQGFVKVNFSF